MKIRASLLLLLLVGTIGALVGVIRANDAELSTLTFEAEALKQEFNASSNLSRMVVILSPT